MVGWFVDVDMDLGDVSLSRVVEDNKNDISSNFIYSIDSPLLSGRKTQSNTDSNPRPPVNVLIDLSQSPRPARMNADDDAPLTTMRCLLDSSAMTRARVRGIAVGE